LDGVTIVDQEGSSGRGSEGRSLPIITLSIIPTLVKEKGRGAFINLLPEAKGGKKEMLETLRQSNRKKKGASVDALRTSSLPCQYTGEGREDAGHSA